MSRRSERIISRVFLYIFVMTVPPLAVLTFNEIQGSIFAEERKKDDEHGASPPRVRQTPPGSITEYASLVETIQSPGDDVVSLVIEISPSDIPRFVRDMAGDLLLEEGGLPMNCSDILLPSGFLTNPEMLFLFKDENAGVYREARLEQLICENF